MRMTTNQKETWTEHMYQDESDLAWDDLLIDVNSEQAKNMPIFIDEDPDILPAKTAKNQNDNQPIAERLRPRKPAVQIRTCALKPFNSQPIDIYEKSGCLWSCPVCANHLHRNQEKPRNRHFVICHHCEKCTDAFHRLAFEKVELEEFWALQQQMCKKCGEHIVEVNEVFQFTKYANAQWWHDNPKYREKTLQSDKLEWYIHPLHTRINHLDRITNKRNWSYEQFAEHNSFIMPKFEHFDYNLDINAAIERVSYADFWD